jgi:hypothetical protein
MSASKTTKSRYLSLAEVATLLEVDKPTQRAKNLYVRRLFRKLERRDRTVYLHQFGKPGAKLLVCVDDLSRLDPHNPSTIQAIRKDLDDLEHENNELRRRVARLERFAERVEGYFKSGSKGIKNGPN